MAEGSEFKVALDGNPALDTCEYTVTDVTNKTATKEVTPLVPVLAAVSGESEKTVELQFNKPESTNLFRHIQRHGNLYRQCDNKS